MSIYNTYYPRCFEVTLSADTNIYASGDVLETDVSDLKRAKP